MTEPTDKQKKEARGLPLWADCEAAVDEGQASPLEKFIYNHEPADAYDPEWRRDLQAALSSRDAETREVLEGLRTGDKCWCEPCEPNRTGPHSSACLAARALWERV